MAEFKCKKCECVSSGEFEIKTDEIKKEKWNKDHKERLELQSKQKPIEDEFETIVAKHNSGWFGLKGFLSPWMTSKCEGTDTLSIINMFGGEPIKQVPYDDSVMSPWLDFIHRKPIFEYIECPVCQCKNYIGHC